MKKLMIAAVAAAVAGGAFAACDIDPVIRECAEVYDVVLNLKTTECKCANVRTVIRGSQCGISTTGYSNDCTAWRQVVTKKVQGVIFACVCDCTADAEGSILDSAVLAPALYDGAEGNQIFWIAKDKVTLDSLLTIKWLARIGKTKAQVEAAGTFGDGIQVAGYGAYDTKNMRVKNINGYAAGVWGADLDCSQDEGGTEPCPAYKLCPTDGALTAQDDNSKTFAAGTWSVKYNASKSKAYFARGANPVPAAVLNYAPATWYVSTAL